MKAVQIQLSEPCSEDWDLMQPNEQGRFCGVCCKTVMDFTNWQPQDIAQYLIDHAAEKPCGRFKQNHLNITINISDILPHVKKWEVPYLQKLTAVILVCFVLTNVACTEQGTHNPQQNKQVALQPDSSVQNFDTTLKKNIENDSAIKHGNVRVPYGEPVIYHEAVKDVAPPTVTVAPVMHYPQPVLGGAPIVVEVIEYVDTTPQEIDSIKPVVE